VVMVRVAIEELPAMVDRRVMLRPRCSDGIARTDASSFCAGMSSGVPNHARRLCDRTGRRIRRADALWPCRVGR